MKNTLLILLTIGILASCKNKTTETETTAKQDTLTELYGKWVGGFLAEKMKTGDYSNNKITLSITRITPDFKVTGESIVSGNKRPLKGIVEIKDGIYSFTLNEPGNNKYDGVFEFTIKNKAGSPAELDGKWTAFDPKLNVTVRNYNLLQMEFKYNKNLMLPEEIYVDQHDMKTEPILSIDSNGNKIPVSKEETEGEEYTEESFSTATDAVYKLNASARILKAEELKNLRKLDLEIIRNTIFARHGYNFKQVKARQFFNNVDWYIPVSNDVNTQLTAIEKQNITLLKRFESYAANHYESFGR